MNLCANCGVEVVRKPSFWKRIKGLACCSKACRAEYLKTAYLGPNNPKYNSGDVIQRWFAQKLTKLQGSAEKREIVISLTKEELVDQYKKQNGLCWYTGIPLKLATTENWTSKNQADFDILSVDRVDSTLGYYKENIVFCCNAINKMKGNSSLQDIQVMFDYIAAKHNTVCHAVFKSTNSNSKAPMKIGLGDVGYDLSVASVEDKGDFFKVGTGIAVQMPIGWYSEVYPRSSLHKKGLMLFNSVGIIDNSYNGEIFLMLFKTNKEAKLEIGERVVQLIPKRYSLAIFTEVQELDKTERADGSFGSTGV